MAALGTKDWPLSILKSILTGFGSMSALLGLYFGVVSGLSGWDGMLSQFKSFWYFIVSLAFGFGVQELPQKRDS